MFVFWQSETYTHTHAETSFPKTEGSGRDASERVQGSVPGPELTRGLQDGVASRAVFKETIPFNNPLATKFIFFTCSYTFCVVFT